MGKSEEIRQQAVRLMADKGFEAISLRQLAAAAGLGAGSIYAHYQSKTHLLREVCCDYLEDRLSAWQEQRWLWPRHPQPQLQAFATIHVAFAWSRAMEARIIQLDARSLDEIGKAAVEELERHYLGELEAILRRGMAEGVFRVGHPPQTCRAVSFLLQGFAGMGAEAAGAMEQQQAINACWESILQLVGGSQEGRQLARTRTDVRCLGS